METTSLETSKRIWELLRWNDTYFYWLGDDMYDRSPRQSDLKDGQTEDDFAPAYDLAYLLGKLPTNIRIEPSKPYWLTLSPLDSEAWSIGYQYENNDEKMVQVSDTPTEAAGLLVIALAEAGILTKEGAVA